MSIPAATVVTSHTIAAFAAIKAPLVAAIAIHRRFADVSGEIDHCAENLPIALELGERLPSYAETVMALRGLDAALEVRMSADDAIAAAAALTGSFGKRPPADAEGYLAALAMMSEDDGDAGAVIELWAPKTSASRLAAALAIEKLVREVKFFPAPAELLVATELATEKLRSYRTTVANCAALRWRIDEIIEEFGRVEDAMRLVHLPDDGLDDTIDFGEPTPKSKMRKPKVSDGGQGSGDAL